MQMSANSGNSDTKPLVIWLAEYKARARQFRAQAIKLEDAEAFEPNWPKFFLMGHSIELALKAYLVFAEPGFLEKQLRDEHDLMALYERATRQGSQNNGLVQKAVAE